MQSRGGHWWVGGTMVDPGNRGRIEVVCLFGWLFFDISTILLYLIPNPLYTYLLNIYMIWFGLVIWHINHCWLFNTKSSLYIYVKYIGFGRVGFNGISTIVDIFLIIFLNEPELIFFSDGKMVSSIAL